MKKQYITAELEIIEFTALDIVTASEPDSGFDDGNDNGGYDSGGWT
ncbi:MAG: hypothetical protein IJW03_02745 [Clostridia bacterium]|nr:hypothetical protein [Clostridia bacterium]